jgi:hypothetical protein
MLLLKLDLIKSIYFNRYSIEIDRCLSAIGPGGANNQDVYIIINKLCLTSSRQFFNYNETDNSYIHLSNAINISHNILFSFKLTNKQEIIRIFEGVDNINLITMCGSNLNIPENFSTELGAYYSEFDQPAHVINFREVIDNINSGLFDFTSFNSILRLNFREIIYNYRAASTNLEVLRAISDNNGNYMEFDLRFREIVSSDPALQLHSLEEIYSLSPLYYFKLKKSILKYPKGAIISSNSRKKITLFDRKILKVPLYRDYKGSSDPLLELVS